MGFRKNGIAIARANRSRMNRGVDGWRRTNDEELSAWRASDASKGMNCAGESKLPPQDTHFDIAEGTIVHVLRARVRARRGYETVSNCMEIMLPCGEVVFARKNDFAPID